MSGFESRLEDDKTTKRRQKSFQSVPVNDYKPEKNSQFSNFKRSVKSGKYKYFSSSSTFQARNFKYLKQIYLNFRAKIKHKFRTKSSKFVRCKKFDFFLDFPTLFYLSSRQYDIKFLVKVWLLGPHLFFLTLLGHYPVDQARAALLFFKSIIFSIYARPAPRRSLFLKREIFTRRKTFAIVTKSTNFL